MSEEEEAELLARALEADDARGPAAIVDVLEVASAVRTRRAALLEEERAQAVLKVIEQRLARARRRRMVFAGGGALAMAAAVTLVFMQLETRTSEPAQVTAAPSAPEAASKQAVGGGVEQALALARLDLLQMQRSVVEGRASYSQSASMLAQYRDAHFIVLKRRYE